MIASGPLLNRLKSETDGHRHEIRAVLALDGTPKHAIRSSMIPTMASAKPSACPIARHDDRTNYCGPRPHPGRPRPVAHLIVIYGIRGHHYGCTRVCPLPQPLFTQSATY